MRKEILCAAEATLSAVCSSLKIKIKPMKSTPAVFLTSLAVSAISLTIPLPEASTVLNLFIGEDLTVQETAYAEGDVCQHEADDATSACTSTDHHGPGKAAQTGGAPPVPASTVAPPIWLSPGQLGFFRSATPERPAASAIAFGGQ